MSKRPLAQLALAALASVPTAQTLAQAPQPLGQRPTGVPFALDRASHGFGQLLPHRVFELSPSGTPTTTLVDVRTLEDLFANVTATNPVQPTTSWPTATVLPNGSPGNHYLVVRFTRAVRWSSVIDPSPGAAASSWLTGALSITAVDPLTGAVVAVRGRPFLNGWTPGAGGAMERRVGLDATGRPVALGAAGLGFPGTEGPTGFAGANELVHPRSFVFVVDSDDVLATHEGFPVGLQVRARITSAVVGLDGEALADEGLASATVGADSVVPAVALSGGGPVVVPGNGDVDVDPTTSVTIEFTEPVRVLSIGDPPDGTPPRLSGAVFLTVGPPTARLNVPFTASPLSPFDLARVELDPAYDFPGAGPGGLCGAWNQVDVSVTPFAVPDLASNVDVLGASTFFLVGDGVGLVNAPVAPDTVYVGRTGSDPAVSVLDLNGFGASTGSPVYDVTCPIKAGNTNYPNNPNVSLQGSLLTPPLAPGTCSFDGGSAGVFTLTKDTHLDDRLVRAPTIGSVGDMALGHALDRAIDNGLPFGCQSGGGNLCATTGLKLVTLGAGGPGTLAPPTPTSPPLHAVVGGENPISFAPHPNPPPLTFPPLCASPWIGGQEPTSIDVVLGPGNPNLLVPGPNPFGVPGACLPPSNLLSPEQNAFFVGPSPPQLTIVACNTFTTRQQVGHFLYLVDRANAEVVVLNSNRMQVLDRIALEDPTSLAMSPNLDFLAVTSESADRVDFVDVDPQSAGFHQVVASVAVGDGPRGVAWQPGNEDVLVANAGDSTLSVISAFTFTERKRVASPHLAAPFEVAIQPRQEAYGFARGVWYACVLNGDGSVALFESGPSGISGWGYDDVIGTTGITFQNPKAIQPDPGDLYTSMWIAHEGQLDAGGVPTGLGGGAVSRLQLVSTSIGQLPFGPGQVGVPQVRSLVFPIGASIGSDQLSGVPTDVAFDDQRNVGALPNHFTSFSAGVPAALNGKGLVRARAGTIVAVSSPQFLFAAVPGGGVVDVVSLASGTRFDTDAFQPGVQSVPAAGASVLAHYFRQ